MAQVVRTALNAVDQAEADPSTAPVRRVENQPFLSEHFDYHPRSLADAEAEASALSPAWASFISQGEHSYALQIAEGELDWLERSGTATPVQLADHQVQIGVTYLTIDAPDLAESFFRAAFYNYALKPKAANPSELTSLCGVWIETLINLGKLDDVMIPVNKMRELHEQRLRDLPPQARPDELRFWGSITANIIDVSIQSRALPLVEKLYPELIANFEQAYGKNSSLYATVLTSFGEYYYGVDRMSECAGQYAQAREILEALGEDHGHTYAIACIRGAQYAEMNGQTKEAVSLADRAIEHLDRTDEKFPYMLRDCHWVKAQVALAGERGVESVRHFDAAIKALQDGKADAAEVLALIEACTAEIAGLGAVEVEERWIRECMSCAESAFGEKDNRSFLAHQNLIRFLDRQQRYGQSLREEERYLAKVAKHHGTTSAVYVEALLEKSGTLFTLDQAEAGELALTTALTIARKNLKLPERKILLDVLEALGDYHARRGDDTMELRFRVICERMAYQLAGPTSIEYGDMILRRGLSYFAKGEFALCENQCDRAIAVFDSAPNDTDRPKLAHATASALVQIALVRIQQRDFEGAQLKIDQTLELLSEHDLLNSVAALRACDALGECIADATSVLPDTEAQGRGLESLLQAAIISKNLGIPESLADVVRQKRIRAFAQAVGDDEAVARAEIELTRFLADGLLEVESGDEEL